MKLSARLWLVGAVLPALVMAVVLVAADRLFVLALERSLDRALLAQAAVESASLFDGPSGAPHLHMATSPLLESVRPFAPEGVLFGPDGVEVARYPVASNGGRREHMGRVTSRAEALLATRRGNDGLRLRELLTTVAAPSGGAYTLRLSASMAQIDESNRSFRIIAGVSVAVAAVLMAGLQVLLGRRLRERLGALQAHLKTVEAGDYESQIAPEAEDDELSVLRGVLNTATVKLREAHEAQVRLLANAAHELRTPLTLMRTNLDLALRRERSPAELKRAITETREEVIRLAGLASRLLDTVALGQGHLRREPVDLSALVHEAVDRARGDAGDRQLRMDVVAPERASAMMHGESVRQAIDNLLSNAMKFSPAGSQVVISVERSGEAWRISVRDEGPGIPAQDREAVFQPFHRTVGGPAGAGLGLTIVREVAHQHHGRAWVSDLSPGAEVVIELPAR